MTTTTQYAAELLAIIDSFEYELCSACLHDLDTHIIAPDPLGHPHIYCTQEGE